MTRGGSRPNAGAKSQAGTPREHTLRFRVAESELAEISAVVPDGALSDLVRTLLLAHVRG